jgi:hypothetical protein
MAVVLYNNFNSANPTDGSVSVLFNGQALPPAPSWLNRLQLKQVQNKPTLVRPGLGSVWGNLTPVQQNRAVYTFAGTMCYNYPNSRPYQVSAMYDGVVNNQPAMLMPNGFVSATRFYSFKNIEMFNIYRTDNSTHTDGIWVRGCVTVAGKVSEFDLNVLFENLYMHHTSSSCMPVLLEGGRFDTVVMKNVRQESCMNSITIGGTGKLLVIDNCSGKNYVYNGGFQKVVIKNSPDITFNHPSVIRDNNYATPSFDAKGEVVAGTPVPPQPPPPPPPPPVEIGTGTGLLAEYYPTVDLQGTPAIRVDKTIDFAFSSGNLPTGINPSLFSTRWYGYIQPKVDGQHTIYLKSNDGVRLWINGQLLIDKWISTPLTEFSATVSLTKGYKHVITIEYFQNGGTAACYLSWQANGVAKEIVPITQLYNDMNQLEQLQDQVKQLTSQVNSLTTQVNSLNTQVSELTNSNVKYQNVISEIQQSLAKL